MVRFSRGLVVSGLDELLGASCWPSVSVIEAAGCLEIRCA